MKMFNKYLLFLISFVILITNSFASNSIDFYRNTLSQKGIYTDILMEKKEDALNTNLEDILVSTGRDNETLLLKSSQFDKYLKSDGFGVWNRVLVICDTPISIDTQLSCNFDGISVDNVISQEVIFPKKQDNIDYFYIPEKYFTYPSEKNTLDDLSSRLVTVGDELGLSKDTVKDSIKVAEFFRYVLVLFFIFNILYYAVPFIKKNPTMFLSLDFYKNILFRFFRWLSKFKIYNVYILLIALFSYPVILLTISLRDLGVFDFEYVIKFLFDTLNPSNFPIFLEYRNIAKVSLFISNYFLTILIFLTISPFLFFNMCDVFKSINLPSVFSKKYLKLYLFGLLGLLAVILLDMYSKYSFLLLMLIIPVFILPIFIDFSILNIPNKLKFTLATLITFIFILTTFIGPNDKIEVKYNSLLTKGKSSVFTPYTKYIAEHERIKPFIISLNNYLFANEFLIAVPNVSIINTLSIEKFNNTPEHPFVFMASSIDKYAKYLLTNESLLKYVTSNEQTKLFIVRSEDIINEDAYIRMTFDCATKPKVLSITAKVYENSFYSERNLDLFTFPGCEKGFVTYKFPINYAVIDSKYALFNLMGFDLNYISKIELIDKVTNTPLGITFIKDPSVSPLVYNNLVDTVSKEITVFIFDKLDDLKFYQESLKLDLSVPLNVLLDEELLDKSFTIWSPKGNVIIDSSSSY